jgi:hypothetical protein
MLHDATGATPMEYPAEINPEGLSIIPRGVTCGGKRAFVNWRFEMSLSARVGETYFKRLIIFYIPLFMYLAAMLFPFYWMLISSVKPERQLNNSRTSPFFVWPRYFVSEQTIKDLSNTELPKEILAKLSKMTPTAKLTDKSIAKLEKTDVPPEIIAKLERLKDKEFIFKRDFFRAVKREVGTRRSIWYRSQLLRNAELKNQGLIEERFVKPLRRKVGKNNSPGTSH